MTKRILYVGTVVITRKRDVVPEDHVARFNNSIMSVEHDTRFAADAWVESLINAHKDEDEPDKWKDNIVRVDARVHEFIFDPEDLNEHKPEYECEFEVTITKRVTRTVSADQCAAMGYDEDEYGAERVIEELFDACDLDDDIEAECEWDREFSLLSVNEV